MDCGKTADNVVAGVALGGAGIVACFLIAVAMLFKLLGIDILISRIIRVLWYLKSKIGR